MRSFLAYFCSKFDPISLKKWIIRRNICLLRYWNRLVKLDDDRLTKYVFISDYESGATWCKNVKLIFDDIGQTDVYINMSICDLEMCSKLLLGNYAEKWKEYILLKPKLRTYCLLKDDFQTESYVKLNLTRSQRSLMAQIRFGILPLQIETGRFRGIDAKFRVCNFCDKVEDEVHFLFSCEKYKDVRHTFLSSISSDIIQGSQADLFKSLCTDYTRCFSKYIGKIWLQRKNCLYI